MRNYRELLIVLALLAVVAVMAIPVVSEANHDAHAAVCQRHLTALYQATLQYQEETGVLPYVELKTKPLWKWWSELIRPYIDSSLSMSCPADPRAADFFRKVQSPLYIPPSPLSFGMNWWLREGCAKKCGAKTRLDGLSRPQEVVLFADSKGPYLMPERFWTYEKAMRHDNETRANFIYADGAVRLQPQSDFGQEKDGKFVTDFSKWHWN